MFERSPNIYVDREREGGGGGRNYRREKLKDMKRQL